MLTTTKYDDVITFNLNDEPYMYYNTKRQCITVLAVKPAFNARHKFPTGFYLFYNLYKDLKCSTKTYLTYEKLCASVLTALAFHNLDENRDIVIKLT